MAMTGTRFAAAVRDIQFFTAKDAKDRKGKRNIRNIDTFCKISLPTIQKTELQVAPTLAITNIKKIDLMIFFPLRSFASLAVKIFALPSVAFRYSRQFLEVAGKRLVDTLGIVDTHRYTPQSHQRKAHGHAVVIVGVYLRVRGEA